LRQPSARRIEYGLREDETIGDDASRIEIEALELGDHLRVAEAFGRMDGQAEQLGELMHRGFHRRLPASTATSRLGVDRHHIMTGADNLGERGGGEFRGAHEGEA
jgi:hypothetical protein